MALRPPDNVSMAARKALRAAVLVHRARESRRVFPPVVHVGVPGGVCADFVVEPDETLDHALRVEVVAALLSRMQARMSRPVVWLTRPGLL